MWDGLWVNRAPTSMGEDSRDWGEDRWFQK